MSYSFTMKKALQLLLAILVSFQLASCRTTKDTTSNESIAFLTVNLKTGTALAGQTGQLKVIATYKDTTTKNLTSTATYTSTNTDLAYFDDNTKGYVTFEAAGEVTLSVTYNTVRKNIPITVVTAESVTVSTEDNTITLDNDADYTATATLSNGKTQDVSELATWSSSDTTVASVSNTAGSRGLVSPITAGTSTITADIYGTTGTDSLTISASGLQGLELTPTTHSLLLDFPVQVKATGIYPDNVTKDISHLVSWSRDITTDTTLSLASAPRKGIWALGTAAGTTVITATYGDYSATTTLSTKAITTYNAVNVTPLDPTLVVDDQIRFKSWGHAHILSGGITSYYVADVTQSSVLVWGSGTTATATVETLYAGLINALATGSSVITAKHSPAVTGGTPNNTSTITVSSGTLDKLEITPNEPDIPTGAIQKFFATAIDSNDNKRDISDTASWYTLKASTLEVLDREEKTLVKKIGASTGRVGATYSTVAGRVNVGKNTATLESIDVTPSNRTLPTSMEIQYSATGNYSDGSTFDLTDSVLWDNQDTSIVLVSNESTSKGKAKTVATGSSTITATFGTISGTTTLTVSSITVSSIEIEPAVATFANGYTEHFKATAVFSNNATRDVTDFVTWYSSDSTVAQPDNQKYHKGAVTGISAGSATLYASYEGVAAGTSALTVSSATISSVSLDTSITTGTVDTSLQLAATAIFSDNGSLDITKKALWSSDDETVIMVNNDPLNSGLITFIAAGTATITVTHGSQTATVTFTVSN
ncbi:MAG: Ig-like domain-containing protein [SAR324 cluster bacterium]|nr:Ig-like domain-containing protein [SAR324 cluster bacterium]